MEESTASMLRRALRICAHERAMLFGRTALAESKTAKKIFGGRISVAQSAARQSVLTRNSQLIRVSEIARAFGSRLTPSPRYSGERVGERGCLRVES